MSESGTPKRTLSVREFARRISAILVVQDRHGEVKGRILAAALGVHEATIRRHNRVGGRTRIDSDAPALLRSLGRGFVRPLGVLTIR